MSDTDQLEDEIRRLRAVIARKDAVLVACRGVMHSAAVMIEQGYSRATVAEHLERGANGAAAATPAGEPR